MPGSYRTGLKGTYVCILAKNRVERIHIGPRAAFVTADQTLRHLRDELQTPNLVRREPRERWEAAGAPTILTRVREEARRISTDHRTLPLPEQMRPLLKRHLVK